MHIQNRLQCMQFNNGNINKTTAFYNIKLIIVVNNRIYYGSLSNDVHKETVWHSNSAYQRMIHCFATMIQTETISYIELRRKFRSNLALLKNLFENFERSTALVYLIYFLSFLKFLSFYEYLDNNDEIEKIK